MRAVRNSSTLGPKSSISDRGVGRGEAVMFRTHQHLRPRQGCLEGPCLFVCPGLSLVPWATPAFSLFFHPTFLPQILSLITYHYSHSYAFFSAKSEETIYSRWCMVAPSLWPLSPPVSNFLKSVTFKYHPLILVSRLEFQG